MFTPAFGWLFRALGGYPVERSTSNDLVAQVTAIINSHPDFILAIAPEGTRKKVERLKTGFYHIARAANIPIVPVGFDYEKKEVVVGYPLYPGAMEQDIETLHAFYRKIKGRNPALGLIDS